MINEHACDPKRTGRICKVESGPIRPLYYLSPLHNNRLFLNTIASPGFRAIRNYWRLTGYDFRGPDLGMLLCLEPICTTLDLFGIGFAAAPTAFFACSE
jgi:hypothetical protein